MSETFFGAILCSFLSGSSFEPTTEMINQGNSVRREPDCVTQKYAFEFGLDGTPSARDSVHQAVLYAALEKKIPIIVILDQDGKEDPYQQEVRMVAGILKIPFATCSTDFLWRWEMTRHFRGLPSDKNLNDLPDAVATISSCELVDLLEKMTLETDVAVPG